VTAGDIRCEKGVRAMALSEFELFRIKKEVGGFCSRRVPEHLHNQVRLEHDIEKHTVIIYEARPNFKKPDIITRIPIAKLTYVAARKIWKLYWQKANGKWCKYEPKESDRELKVLIEEINQDPYACFFG
jgi:hypothetical protein